MSRPVRRTPIVSMLALAGVASLTSAASAATITVDTDLDLDAADGVCSLREAILAANGNVAYNDCAAGNGADRIVFALALPEIIVLTDHLPAITGTLAIHGPGATQLTLDGDTLYRPLNLDRRGGGWLLVDNLSVTHGRNPAGDLDGGGARVAPGDTAIFRRVRFIGNRAAGNGGGLSVGSYPDSPADVTLSECLFADNVAEGQAGGGGLYAKGSGDVVRIVGSTFWGNRAEHGNGSGGGMRANRAIVTIEASTVSGNTATAGGGGMFVASDNAGGATLIIRDSTISDNTAVAAGGGGGIYFNSSPDHPLLLWIENTVVAANSVLTAPFFPDVGCNSLLTLQGSGSSFIGSNEGCPGPFPAGAPNSTGDFVGTAAAPLDPLLEFLTQYGGPTPTHRPSRSPLSPLIDQGTCPAAITDQRGYGNTSTGLRPVDLPTVANAAGGDGCDIGAFEVQATAGASPLIFADGFEVGHTLLWSSEVP